MKSDYPQRRSRLRRGVASGAALVFAALLASASASSPSATNSAEPLPAAPQAPPWAAEASTQIGSRDLEFHDGNVRLKGTLYFPVGRRPTATVVVLHAAAFPTRDMPLYAHLRTALPSLGVAVFVYDRRDSGQSDRAPGGYDFDLLTQDGVAAADMLRRLPEIDGRHVGYWGLSQGGWLALLCASHDPRASFAVSVSAPITTPDVQMNFAVANILRVNGYSQADIDRALAARQAVDGYLRGQVTREAAQEDLDRAKQAPWFKLAYLSERLGDPATSDWLKQMRLQPLTTLSGLKAPTLMLYGANDPWVPVAASVETLRAHAAEYPNVELHVIPQADHTMMVGVDPKLQMDSHSIPSAAPDSPAYFMTLAAWLTGKGLASAAPR